MTGKTINCCSCNATLDMPEGINKIFCLHCGTPNLLTDVLEIPGIGLKCMVCGVKNKDTAVYCSKCGANLQKECPLCGEMHTHDTVYCSKTGGNIKEAERKRQEPMVLIPAGTFQRKLGYVKTKTVAKKTVGFLDNLLGDTTKKIGIEATADVQVDSFYVCKYPVTNKEYKIYASGHKGHWSEPDYPVETVSWCDAIAYCNWLSDKDGLPRCYSGNGANTVFDISKKGYRLPTEAEWEYACRAGTFTEYYWGNYIDEDYCWYDKNSNNQVHPVGQKRSNALGLYDMSGNVCEWCWDWYNGDYYKVSPTNNPTGPSTGSYRVFRGGSWSGVADCCRSGYRGSILPGSAGSGLGFRLVRSAP